MSKSLLIGLLTSVLMTQANAADVWHISTVKSVYPQGDGTIVLVMDVDSPDCPAQGPNKYHSLVVGQNGVTAEGMKHIYAAALLAKASGSIVQINFSNSTTSCYINRLLVTG